VAAGVPAEPASLINSLLLVHPREVYLSVLTALNHAAPHPELAEAYRGRFLARLTPALADHVSRVIDGEVDGNKRALLARQPVLRAMRMVLTFRRPEGAPPAETMRALAPGMDPELSGMLLVHLTATQQQSQRPAGEPMFGGLPESLAMEMVANGLFHGGEQPDVLLARTRMLWETYGSQIDLKRLKLRARPLDLLREATGLDFDDIAALTFAYHGYIRAHQPGQPSAVNAFAGIQVSRETVETYLATFASTVDELAGKLDASSGSWQMLPVQERALLRVGEALLVLDEQYLIERATGPVLVRARARAQARRQARLDTVEHRLRQHGRTAGRGPVAPDDPAAAGQRQPVLHRGGPAGRLSREEEHRRRHRLR